MPDARPESPSDPSRHVAIIGAGIVGIATAIWLQRSGHLVTVIDRHGPAGGTSYGNAGVLAAASIVPVAVPGLWKKVPFMLFDGQAPLFMRWSHFPKALPFLARFMANARRDRVEAISHALSTLLYDTVEQHLALARGTGAERYVRPGDYLFGYADREEFLADRFAWDMRAKHGHDFVEMDRRALEAYDPALKGLFGYAVRCPNHGHISDPGAYVEALAEHMVGQGGRMMVAEVTGIETGEESACLATSSGVVRAEHVVVAAGAWSKGLAATLGLNVPLESERGYHLEFVNPSLMPKAPVMVAAGKFVMTPMEGRLRCAGVVEFGALNDRRSRAPFELLKRQTLQLLPGLTYDRIEEWMGHRPSTPDSLPLIGRFDTGGNIWSAFGHQHVGLTAGPKTGRWIAQMISGKQPNANLELFAPDRFNRHSGQRARTGPKETTS